MQHPGSRVSPKHGTSAVDTRESGSLPLSR